jgi:molybdopterin-binding protein
MSLRLIPLARCSPPRQRAPTLKISAIAIFEGIDMKLSARNQIKGKVIGVQRGATTGHVRIDVGNGIVITASITNEAIDELALAVGDDAIAVIKASDVMVAK